MNKVMWVLVALCLLYWTFGSLIVVLINPEAIREGYLQSHDAEVAEAETLGLAIAFAIIALLIEIRDRLPPKKKD